jgi:hypothetical protein
MRTGKLVKSHISACALDVSILKLKSRVRVPINVSGKNSSDYIDYITPVLTKVNKNYTLYSDTMSSTRIQFT